MDRNEIRRLANELAVEYSGDMRELYAHVCNQLNRAKPNEDLLALKRELEHRITLEVMEEYGWERDDMGYWREVSHNAVKALTLTAAGKSAILFPRDLAP